VTDVLTRLTAALADRYRLERELGEGGMATVYLAQDLRHDRRVAVKVLRPELAAVIGAERFLSEIKTTANLQHPHILPLFDSGEADGFLFYVMPFIAGETVRDRLTREKQLSIADAVRIATEVASALDSAHRHNVIHRDIKPENILLHDGSALVADFGIALAASKAGTRMTDTGLSLGTPHYMSPEQAMGERDITARSDVYALGCVLYEMLCGEPPFTGPNAQAIIARVMTEEPRSLTLQRKTIPPHVEAAVHTALQKLPADRFPTAAQFAEALSRPGASMPSRTYPMAGAVTSPRHRWLGLVPWGVAIAAGAVAAWAWLGRKPAEGANWQYVTLGGTSTLFPPLALSPDGRTLAFRDNRQNGLMWIKRWDQLDPVPMPGTERSTAPVFSPDGEWLAFLADGRLKKMRSGGGTAVTLVDSLALGSYNIAWLDDGTLVYTGVEGRNDRLSRVSANGGVSAMVLADSSLRGYGLQGLAPLPDARGVLFLACTSGCVTTAIHVLDLRTGTQKPLVENVVAAWYLPTGHILYVRRDGAALAAPFDLDRLEITGAAIPVLDRIMVSPGYALLAWSPAGTLVYLRGTGTSSDAELMRVARNGRAVPVDTGWFGGFNSIALSPDGRRLAVGSGLSSGGLSIWVKQLDRGPFTRLTFGGQDRRPAWSPDGKRVAFVRDSGNGGNVYARPVDGSGADRLLARIDRPIQEVTWSGDGAWLVVRTDNGTAGLGDLVGIRTSGDTTPVPLVATEFTELHPAVSPDGRWLAYTSNESGANEIYVRPFPGTSAGRWQVSNGGGTQPQWSADGRELFFLDGNLRLTAAQIQAAPAFVVLRLQQLFDASGYNIDPFHQSYAVIADGQSFLLTRPRLGAGQAAPGVVLVEHWFDDLRARLKQ